MWRTNLLKIAKIANAVWKIIGGHGKEDTAHATAALHCHNISRIILERG